jgi:flagellar biosynthetic protein FliR
LFDFVTFGAEKLQFLLLIILRTSGLFIIAPVLGYRTLPAAAKVAFALLMSMLLSTILTDNTLPVIESEWHLLGLAMREIIIGLLIGFFFQLIFIAVHAAGALVGYQIGFAMVAMFDPNSSQRVSIIGQFWFLFATLIFLAIDGHHIMITSFVDSYTILPIGHVTYNMSIATVVAKASAYVFVLALKIAAPVLMTLFLTDVALGTVAKMMPTMNVFFVGFPVKIGAGLMVIAMSLPIAAYVLEKGMRFVNNELQQMYFSVGGV